MISQYFSKNHSFHFRTEVSSGADPDLNLRGKGSSTPFAEKCAPISMTNVIIFLLKVHYIQKIRTKRKKKISLCPLPVDPRLHLGRSPNFFPLVILRTRFHGNVDIYVVEMRRQRQPSPYQYFSRSKLIGTHKIEWAVRGITKVRKDEIASLD